MVTKICVICKCEKDISEFHLKKGGKFGKHSQCKLCKNEISRKHYLENQEYELERCKKHHKKYYNEHKIKFKISSTEYRNKNKLKIKIQKSEYDKSPDGKLSRSKRDHRRRMLEFNSVCDLTLDQWVSILVSQENKCNICGRTFDDRLRPEKDHIIPISKGGGLTYNNVQALCKSCNSSKSNRH